MFTDRWPVNISHVTGLVKGKLAGLFVYAN